MKSVEILLREHVPDLGRCGDVVKVKAGYARNYLFPRHLAVQATEENKRVMKRRRERLDIEEAARLEDIVKTVAALEQLTLATIQRADEQGHLYGSVTAAVIAGLIREKGFDLDEKHVRLPAPIKQIGSHEVELHIHAEHHARITVEVKAE